MENKSDLHDINVNVTNNNGNINVTNNIITNNITIDVNLLGQENIDFLYGANFLEACLPNMPGMKDLLELIHASKEHPENHNIYLKNSKQNVYFIKTDKGKELISCNELSKKILDINIERIEDFLHNDTQYTEYEKIQMKEYITSIKNDPSNILKTIKTWLMNINFKIDKPNWIKK